MQGGIGFQYRQSRAMFRLRAGRSPSAGHVTMAARESNRCRAPPAVRGSSAGRHPGRRQARHRHGRRTAHRQHPLDRRVERPGNRLAATPGGSPQREKIQEKIEKNAGITGNMPAVGKDVRRQFLFEPPKDCSAHAFEAGKASRCVSERDDDNEALGRLGVTPASTATSRAMSWKNASRTTARNRQEERMRIGPRA